MTVRCPVCKARGHTWSCPRLMALQSLAESVMLANGVFTPPATGAAIVRKVPSLAWRILVNEAARGLGRPESHQEMRAPAPALGPDRSSSPKAKKPKGP